MYTKIEVATASQTSLPLIHHLINTGRLSAVIVPTSYPGAADFFRQYIPHQYLKLISDPKTLNPYKETDLIISYGYPATINLISGLKMINIHFGKLPENRGADPLFRNLLTGDPKAFVTIHEMTEKLDEGDILKEQSFDIIPGEFYGMLNNRLANMSVTIIDEVLTGHYEPVKQDTSAAKYYGMVTEQETFINWQTMNARQIVQLVNACNPKYGGAKTSIMGSQLSISEASVAIPDLNTAQAGSQPGSIVHSHPDEGVFISCKDNTFIRLDIISTSDGLLSGRKLAGIGVQPGIVLGR